MSSSSNDNAWIVYDGACPFCRNYVSLVKLRENIGQVELFNARERGPEVEKVINSNFDLDEGMVLYFQGQMYHGVACIHMIALLSSDDTWFGRINKWVFKSSERAKTVYPILRFFRNITLKFLQQKKIGHD